VVQQLLIQGMLTRNLKDAGGWSSSPHVVTPAAALLFGIVHLPNWKLTGATTALGLAFTPIYLKHRNLWPLGFYHGVLGALFYFWVLEENPWRDLTS
jgi:membrane protease YdiL (CAAX protease family)